jgi:hypothetical protein
LYTQSKELGPLQRKSHLKNYTKSLYMSGLWVLHRAMALYPNATCLHQALINLHTFSSAMGLTGLKLVLACVKKALGLDLYAPFRQLIELTVGIPLLAPGGRGLYEQKLLKYRTLVAVSAIWAPLPRGQVA